MLPCNVGSAIAAAYTFYTAWRRRPAGTALGAVLVVDLTFWWLAVLVRRYDDRA